MNQFVFILLIGAAVSAGIFGKVTTRGAQLVKFDRRLAVMAAIWGVCALGETWLGHLTGRWILSFDLKERDILLVHIIAGFILVAAGMRMLFLSFERKILIEHRMDEIDVRHDAILGIRLCLLSLMAGAALGLLEYSLKEVLLVIGCMSVCFTAAGYLAGRAYGVGLCRRAYIVSGALLCAAGVLVQLPGA